MKIISVDIPFDKKGRPIFAQLCDTSGELHKWWETFFFHFPKPERRQQAASAYKECAIEWCDGYADLPRPDIATTAGVDLVLNENAHAAVGTLMKESGDFYIARLGDERMYLYLSWETVSDLDFEVATHHAYHIHPIVPSSRHSMRDGSLFVSESLLEEITKNNLSGLVSLVEYIEFPHVQKENKNMKESAISKTVCLPLESAISHFLDSAKQLKGMSTAEDAFAFMTDFYLYCRIENSVLANDDDMILLQWGGLQAYVDCKPTDNRVNADNTEFEEDERYWIGITRQVFAPNDADTDFDGEAVSMDVMVFFDRVPENEEVESGDEWINQPDGLDIMGCLEKNGVNMTQFGPVYKICVSVSFVG